MFNLAWFFLFFSFVEGVCLSSCWSLRCDQHKLWILHGSLDTSGHVRRISYGWSPDEMFHVIIRMHSQISWTLPCPEFVHHQQDFIRKHVICNYGYFIIVILPSSFAKNNSLIKEVKWRNIFCSFYNKWEKMSEYERIRSKHACLFH